MAIIHLVVLLMRLARYTWIIGSTHTEDPSKKELGNEAPLCTLCDNVGLTPILYPRRVPRTYSRMISSLTARADEELEATY